MLFEVRAGRCIDLPDGEACILQQWFHRVEVLEGDVA